GTPPATDTGAAKCATLATKRGMNGDKHGKTRSIIEMMKRGGGLAKSGSPTPATCWMTCSGEGRPDWDSQQAQLIRVMMRHHKWEWRIQVIHSVLTFHLLK